MAADRVVEAIKRVCPFCGGGVLLVDESKSVMHEVPVCAGFTQLMRDNGGTPECFVVYPVEDPKDLPS